jgi:hypothetical protein
VPYLLVSLGGILNDILGGILIFLVTAIQLLQFSTILVLWFWDFLSCELSLEKYALSWLSVGSSVASRIILFSKVYGAQRCLRAYGWVTIL